MSRRVRRALYSALALLVIACLMALTWWVARSVQSPAQREAAAAAPTLGPVLVPVSRGDLVDQITANATMSSATDAQIALASSEGRSVVTSTRAAAGDALSSGQVVLTINSRPLILLPGSFPTYRDITQGDTGEDVRQLQEALASLGYRVRADGSFGAATAKAVRALYAAAGFTPPRAAESASGASGADSSSRSRGSADGGASSGDGAGDSAAAPQVARTVLSVPQSEILFVPRLDAHPTLVSLPAVGTILDEDSARLTMLSGGANVTARIPATTAKSLKIGARAHLSEGQERVDLTLTSMEPSAQTDKDTKQDNAGASGEDSQAATFDVTFTPVSALPAQAASASSLLLTIERTPTITDTLLLPRRAISSLADGSGSVMLQGANGTFTQVPVKVTACVGGQCAITAAELKPGHLVRVDGS